MSRSKFFRVATEGATTDGRKISRDWIVQAAKNFNLKKYSPRIWLEHLRGTLPDSPFKAYGDVVAVKAEEVEDGKMALFAQIEPTQELIEINKARQKLYTSIEINPSFADTGEAYLVGLGVTDSPASLGTEMLQFSAQHNVLSTRKQDKGNLFTAAIETVLEFEEETKENQSLTELVKNMFFVFRKKADEEIKSDVIQEFTNAIEPVVEGITNLESQYAESKSKINALEAEMTSFKTQLATLANKLSQENYSEPSRPAATGEAKYLAEC